MEKHFLMQLKSLERPETNQYIDQHLPSINRQFYYPLIHNPMIHHYQTRYLEYPILK